jgi:putative Holliday junction resolvase
MKILALDIGDAWTGSAITDALRLFARPYQTVASQDLKKFLQQVFAKEAISTVVVGLPKTLKGTDSRQTQITITKKEQLETQFSDKKWVLWDERLTSKSAAKIKSARSKEEKLQQHSIAAAIILESYLPLFNSQND